MEQPQRVCGIDDAHSDAKLEYRRMRALRWKDIKYLLLRLAEDWFRHKVPRLGASLAFYTLLSMAPLLVVVLAVAGFAYGREAAAGQLVWQIRELVGSEGARAIQALVQGAHEPTSGGIAAALGLITLFFGATAVVAELRDALNTIWEVPPKPSTFGLRALVGVLRDRTVAFAVVLAFGFLLLVSLVINAVVAAIGAHFAWLLTAQVWVIETVNAVVSFLVICGVFALLFKYLPDIEIAWSDVTLGAVGTGMLFTLGKVAIGQYLGRAAIGSSYGAAGSLVIVLVWVYYSAQIFFLGAEFTQVYAACFGSQPKERQRRVEQMHISNGERPEVTLEVPGAVPPAKLEV